MEQENCKSKTAADGVVFLTIRLRKQDSAFVYHVFEAHEGICSYSTLDHEPGSFYRDLEFQVPIDFIDEVERVLKELGESFDVIRLSTRS